jgi:hypothetical protein
MEVLLHGSSDMKGSSLAANRASRSVKPKTACDAFAGAAIMVGMVVMVGFQDFLAHYT